MKQLASLILATFFVIGCSSPTTPNSGSSQSTSSSANVAKDSIYPWEKTWSSPSGNTAYANYMDIYNDAVYIHANDGNIYKNFKSVGKYSNNPSPIFQDTINGNLLILEDTPIAITHIDKNDKITKITLPADSILAGDKFKGYKTRGCSFTQLQDTLLLAVVFQNGEQVRFHTRFFKAPIANGQIGEFTPSNMDTAGWDSLNKSMDYQLTINGYMKIDDKLLVATNDGIQKFENGKWSTAFRNPAEAPNYPGELSQRFFEKPIKVADYTYFLDRWNRVVKTKDGVNFKQLYRQQEIGWRKNVYGALDTILVSSNIPFMSISEYKGDIVVNGDLVRNETDDHFRKLIQTPKGDTAFKEFYYQGSYGYHNAPGTPLDHVILRDTVYQLISNEIHSGVWRFPLNRWK